MQAPSLVQVPSKHRLLGFLAQRLKQRDRELNGPSSSHSTWTALQAEEKEAAGPSWSVDSENSDLQLAGDGPKPEFIRGQQTETQPNPSEAIASTSVERRGGGALGGWLTRLTGAYSVAGARYIHCRRAMVSWKILILASMMMLLDVLCTHHAHAPSSTFQVGWLT